MFLFFGLLFFATGGTRPTEERESSENSVKYRSVMEGKDEKDG